MGDTIFLPGVVRKDPAAAVLRLVVLIYIRTFLLSEQKNVMIPQGG